MAIPDAVQRQADAADAMIKQAAEKTPEAPPQAVVENQDPAPQVPPASTEPVEPQAQPVVSPPDKDYKVLYENLVLQLGEQPYKVLQGKYNAEVPRLHADIRILKDQIAQLSQAAPPAPAAPQVPAGSDAFAKMREDYGDDFVNSIVGIVKTELQAGIAPVAEQVKRSEQDKYLDRLTAIMPDWRSIMNDPQFDAFLNETDPLSGRPLRDMAIEADAAGDANRVARFYQMFKGRSVPAPQTAAQAPVTPQDRREALVAPAAQKGQPAAPAPAGPKTYQAIEIKRFHDDVARGHYLNKPDELKRLTAEFDLAISQGRVIR